MGPFELSDVFRRIEAQDNLDDDIRKTRQAQEEREMRERAELKQEISAIREDIHAIRLLLERLVNTQTETHS